MADPQAETLCKSVYTDCDAEAIHACQKPLGHEGVHEDEIWMWHDCPPMGSPSVFEVTGTKDALIRLTRKISALEARNEALLQALKTIIGIPDMSTDPYRALGGMVKVAEAALDSGSASQEAKTPGL